MIPAKGSLKNYHWGKKGQDCHIAHFLTQASRDLGAKDKTSNQNDTNNYDKNTPLAELWFGSHPSGPAKLLVGDKLIKLDEFLAKEPEMVGAINQYFKHNKQLPFLFKLLSIEQPLSLQAHPDKELAQALHKQDPSTYPDDNHKPELAIALTDFQVLCDFRPHEDIVGFIKHYKPLRIIVGENNAKKYVHLVDEISTQSSSATTRDYSLGSANLHQGDLKTMLASCFQSLMTCSKEIIIEQTKQLMANNATQKSDELLTVVAELGRLYPGDPGTLAPFFLNYLKLSPGQGVFLKQNKLHAYLKGECIECMACSDNVVRAGLTTKFRDVQTIITMLDYEPVRSANELILQTHENRHTDWSILTYPAPCDEFKVEKISVSNKREISLDSKSSGSFVLVLKGEAVARDFFDLGRRYKLCFGSAAFIPPKVVVKVEDIKGTLVMYRAFCDR